MEKNEQTAPDGVQIRYTEAEDGKYLKQWLMDQETTRRWFPMYDEIEIDDAVMRWVGFYRYKCSLTATFNGEPCGIATLYLQPYRKLSHQCEFGIIVSPEHRNKHVGSYLLNSLIHLAKTQFKIELLHLQVYENNPAINLYQRFGFTEFGRQKSWIKEEDHYAARIFMERWI